MGKQVRKENDPEQRGSQRKKGEKGWCFREVWLAFRFLAGPEIFLPSPSIIDK